MGEFLSMFQLDSGHPWWHFVVRAAVVYLFLLFALRMLGSRPLAQLSKFDIILVSPIPPPCAGRSSRQTVTSA